MLALGGLVSFTENKNAMESVALSFGRWGGRAVALCNVLQLFGWTIIMVVQAAQAVKGIFSGVPFALFAGALAVLVLVWALILGSPAQALNNIIVALLVILCALLFHEACDMPLAKAVPASGGAGTFALGIELAVAMPVSWLPLVGDYSRGAKDKASAALMPFAGYFIASCLMYLFGLYIALKGGDIFSFIAGSRYRFAACAVVVLSTLTTAFLDLYSAAESSELVLAGRNKRLPILFFGVLVIAVSAIFPPERYSAFLEGFILDIGMVFVPVDGVLFTVIVVENITHAKDTKLAKEDKKINWAGIITAILGMVVYKYTSVKAIGSPTLITLAFVVVLTFLSVRVVRVVRCYFLKGEA
jgi:putative hydroxymethylpyrimidine transporter CytX